MRKFHGGVEEKVKHGALRVRMKLSQKTKVEDSSGFVVELGVLTVQSGRRFLWVLEDAHGACVEFFIWIVCLVFHYKKYGYNCDSHAEII